MERGAELMLIVLKNPEAYGWTTLEGKLNADTSPRDFPHLDRDGRWLLRGAATAIHLSRIYLLLSERSRSNYILPDLIKLTDVANELVLTKNTDPLLFPPEYDLDSLYLSTWHRYDGLNNITPDGIAALDMRFVPINSSRQAEGVSINFRPNPLRTYSAKGYEYLDGLVPDKAREDLGFKRIDHDEIVRVVGTHSYTPRGLTVSSSGAKLEINFPGEESGRKSTDIDLVTCQLSLTSDALIEDLIQVQLPVSYFGNATVFRSQDTLEKWSGRIALNLAKRAKPVQGVQVSLYQKRRPQEAVLV